MHTQTGDHAARLRAAKEEPSPITALRDMLATAFAADIAAVTPMVCDAMRESALEAANPARRELIENAIAIVTRNRGALALEVVQMFRSRFDAKLKEAKVRRAFSSPLALMDEPVLDINIALEQSAARLKEQSGAEMLQISARVAEMLGKASLDDAENPIVPRVFVTTLADALATLGFDAEEHLAAFRAFGPPLLSIAPDLYNHANALLSGLDESHERAALEPLSVAAPHREKAAVIDELVLADILARLLTGVRGTAPTPQLGTAR
ncbi:MAG: DUF1631 family protein [Usitatibacter sp.]